jgi:hypothetical protein
VGEVLIGILLMVAGGILLIPFIAKRMRLERMRSENQIMQEILREEEELKRIKKTMTPAEWEIYKVQKENQKLLKQIKDKPSGASGPTAMYGIVNDISD